jgi:serine/threonine protein kinase
VTTGTLIMGTYEIESLINSGGMGEVYRGRNIHNGEPCRHQDRSAFAGP